MPKPRRAHRTSTGESPEHRDHPVGPIGRARSARITALVLQPRVAWIHSAHFFLASPILVRSNASTDPAHPPLHWTDRRYTRHTLTHSTHTRIATMSTPILRAPIAQLRITTPLPSRSTNTPGTAPRPPAHRNGAAGLTRRPQLAPPRAASTSAPSGSGSKKPKTNVTDMYVALREMERAAEEAETECVINASNSSEQSRCTERYLAAAEEIEAAKLAALASGTGAQEERLIAKAAVKKARADRIDELATAAEDELECVADGG